MGNTRVCAVEDHRCGRACRQEWIRGGDRSVEYYLRGTYKAECWMKVCR